MATPSVGRAGGGFVADTAGMGRVVESERSIQAGVCLGRPACFGASVARGRAPVAGQL